MAVEVGSAYVTVWPKMEGSKWASEIDKALQGADIGGALSKSFNSGNALSSIGNAFTKISKVGVAAMAGIATAVAGLAIGGGIARSLKIDEAQMKFDALGMDATAAMESCSQAVNGTRFGLDAAAIVAAQFGAAGIQAGQGMTDALKSVTGIATLAGTSMEDIGSIFATVAARGKVSGEDLLRLNERGVAATQALATHLGVTAAEVTEMVSSGKVDFQTFQEAMYATFGEAAFKANETFSGAMANVQAALSRVGQKFADPALEGLRQIFVALMPAINAVGAALQPLADRFASLVNFIVSGTVPALEAFTNTLNSTGSIVQAIKAAFDTLPPSLQAVAAAAAALAGAMGIAVIASKVQPLIGIFSNLGTVGSGAFKGIGSALKAIPGPIGVVLGVAAALAAAFVYLYNTNEPFRASMQALGAELMSQLQPALQAIMTALQTLASAVIPVITQLISALAPVIAQIITVLAQLVAGILPVIVSLITQLTPIITQIITVIMQLATAILPPIVALLTSLMPIITQIINVIMQLVSAILPPLTALLTALMPIITQIITLVVQIATQLIALVMPVIEQILALIQTVMPVIQQIITTVMTAILAIIEAVWPAIQSIIETVMNVIQGIIETVWPIIQTIIETAMNVIQAVISTVMALIQGDWEGVWNGIQQIAQAIWDGICNLIDAAINAISNVISSVLNAIKGVWDSIWGAISSFAQSVWNTIQSVISSAISAVQNAISSALNAISSLWNSIWSAVSSFVSQTWSNICNAVSSGVSNVIGFISGLPGQIMGFFADAGSWLINAGRSIIDGLLNGIKSAVGAVWDFVSGIGAKIMSLKGPEEYDKRLLIPAGQWIMQSLETGLANGMPGVERLLEGFTDDMSAFKFNPINLERPDSMLSGLYDYEQIYNPRYAVTASGYSAPSDRPTADDFANTLYDVLSQVSGPVNLYLDGNLVASTIAGPMDAALAMRSARGGRY